MQIPRGRVFRITCGILFFAACVPVARCGEETITLVNPGFESGLDGWSADKGDNGMSVASTEAAHSGKQGLRVTDNDPKKGSAFSSAHFDAKADMTFEVRFWARCISGGGVGVYLQFVDASGNKLTDLEDTSGAPGARVNVMKVTVPSRTTEWKQFTLRGVAPKDATAGYLWVHSGVSGSSVTDLDDFELVKVN